MDYNKIRNLIAIGRLSEAIKELRNFISESDHPSRDDILLESSRLNRKLLEAMRGTTNTKELDLLMDQVTEQILLILKKVENGEYKEEEKKEKSKDQTTNYIKGDFVKGDKYQAKKIIIRKK